MSRSPLNRQMCPGSTRSSRVERRPFGSRRDRAQCPPTTTAGSKSCLEVATHKVQTVEFVVEFGVQMLYRHDHQNAIFVGAFKIGGKDFSGRAQIPGFEIAEGFGAF